MADFVYNIAKGRIAEYANRVNSNDPTNSILVVVAINANAVSDATLQDLDDLAAILATAADEVTNTGYARKTLDQTSGIIITVDDTNNRVDVDLPDLTWTGVAAGSAWTDLIVCYDSDSTGGSDSNIIPLTQHDFSVPSPDGTDILAQINAAGFFRAS